MDPRGIRNNNPGNIRAGVGYDGENGVDDAGFATFDTPDHGIQALSTLLDAYSTNHGLNTVGGIIGRYAPTNENDTNRYAATVSSQMGVTPDQQLDLTDPKQKKALMDGIINYENGQNPYDTSPFIRGAGNQNPALTPPMLQNYSTTGGKTVDTSAWVNPSELLSPDTPDIPRNPLAPEAHEQQAIQDSAGPQNSEPQQNVNLLGSESDYQSAKDTERGLNMPFWDVVPRAFRSQNSIKGMWDWAEREIIPSDPSYDWNGGRDEFEKEFPQEYWGAFNQVNSKSEADMLSWQLRQEMGDRQMLANAGQFASIAALGTGFLDVDTALAIATGGASEIVKGGVLAGRLLKIKDGVYDGLKAGALVNGANAYFRPSGNFHEMAMGTLMNGLIGGAAGGFGPLEREHNQTIYDTAQDYNDFRGLGDDARANYKDDPGFRPMNKDDLMGSTAMSGDSAGAARYADPNRPITSAITPEQKKALGLGDDEISDIDRAQMWREDSGWNDAKARAFDAYPRLKRVVDLFNKVPLFRTDWEALANSKSAVLNKISYDLLENPLGYLVNNTSAAVRQHLYLKQIMGPVQQPIEDAYQEWARAQGLGWKERNWNTQARQQFGRQMQTELMRRRFGDPIVGPIDKHVIKAADNWNTGMDTAFSINVGKPGEHAVKGFDGVQWKEGYFPFIWKGGEIDKAIDRLGYSSVQKSFAEAYADAHPNLRPDEAAQIADAVISVARAKDSEVDMNLVGLLSGDGRSYLLRELEKKIGPAEAQLLVNRLGGKVEERGVTGRAKGRTEIDARRTLEDGTPILHMMENDPQRLLHQYSRQTAGQASLARAGYTSKAEISKTINLALQEQKALGVIPGTDGYVSREQLETIFSYFGGGVIGQGVHPVVRMMQQVTNLALLNQLGLQQLAESATTMAAVGWKEWIRYAPTALRDAFTGKNNDVLFHLSKELEPLMGGIGDMHNVYRSDLVFDTIQRNPSFTGQWMDVMEKALNKGARIQGFTTGFYQIQAAQHRLVTELMTQKVIKDLRGGVLSPEVERRLAEAGISGRYLQRLKRMVDQHVQWDAKGNVEMLNINKWDAKTQEDFALSMNRLAGMQVQHTFAGEGSYRMHDTTGALLTHLKSFPLIAIKKQFGRNARLMDPQTKLLFLYGMGLGSAMYALKQAINGNTDRLGPLDVAKGGFGLSNLTGWIPMFTDPVATMLGMDSLRFNEYGARGVDSGIISPPPMFPTLNKLGHLPGAALDFLTGSPTSTDYAAAKVLPLVGNYYGVSGMLNGMRADTKGAKLDPAQRQQIDQNNQEAQQARLQARQVESQTRNDRAQQRLKDAQTGNLPEDKRKALKDLQDQVHD